MQNLLRRSLSIAAHGTKAIEAHYRSTPTVTVEELIRQQNEIEKEIERLLEAQKQIDRQIEAIFDREDRR